MEWLVENKDWLLSGAFVAIPIALISWLLSFILRNSKVMKQKGGNNSINIQAGNDIQIKEGTERKNGKEDSKKW